MLVGVLALYARGERLTVPGREVCGELVISRSNLDKTTVAKLYYPGGAQSLVRQGIAAPELYEPVVKTLARGRLDIRGLEHEGKAWHLQLWSCRLITSLESQAMQRNGNVAPSGLHALYLRWWDVLWEAVVRQEGPRRYCDVADMPTLLEAPLEEVWPFVEWAALTARGVSSLGGKDSLGCLELRLLEPRLLEGPYCVAVEGHSGALGVDAVVSPVAIRPVGMVQT